MMTQFNIIEFQMFKMRCYCEFIDCPVVFVIFSNWSLNKETDGASDALDELYNIDIFPNLLFPDKKSPQVVAGDRYQIHFELLFLR